MNSDASSENPYQSPQVETLSDGKLLRRFSAERDPAAFESLVARYGPLVWSVCRRTLHNREDAEDAFQATFLILLNHADSIRQRKSLGSWLFGVARRVAKKSLRAEYRRLQFLHRLVPQRAVVAAEPAPAADDVRKLLALEIAELPEMQRTVIEKCALAGESYRQVAGELRIPLATVASHLRRGRKRLRARLLARGIGAAGLAGMITTLPCAAAAPSEMLYKATAENAAAFLAEGQAALPIRIVSLMKGVAIKMPITAKCLLAVWLSLGTGASTWWAVHGTKGREIDSGVQVAVDAGSARVLDVDAPDAALEFKTVPYFIRSQGKLQLLGREPVQRDLGLNKEQIETLGKIMRPGGRVSMTELDKQLAMYAKKSLNESQLARLEEIYVQAHGAETLFNPTIATKLRLSDDQKNKLNEVRKTYMEKHRAWAKSLKELRKEDREKRRASGEQRQEMMKEFDDTVMSKLTSEQLDQFKKLRGKPIDLSGEKSPLGGLAQRDSK